MRRMFDRAGTLVLFTLALTLLVRPARATWSLILLDTHTGEIAIGSATCVANIDLKRFLPVMPVGIGGACAQAQVDTTGANRVLIWNQLRMGTDPAQILILLEQQDLSHQRRQYGIVDMLGRAVTFTGSLTSAWAGGVTGQQGTMVYAIQGNILTGAPVVQMAEQAVLNPANGDLPGRLMAAMEAARSMGGDGRCSCPGNPTGCGSPPPSFTKSAHVGFMVISRAGDTDGSCTASGCATGNYFMDFNVAFQGTGDPDPIFQLQALFDAFRQAHIGRPDAIQSTAVVTPPSVPANGMDTAVLNVALIDWQGTQLPGPVNSVTVQHDTGSAGRSTIGPVQDNGDGTYTVVLTAGTRPGLDKFRVTADDGVRPVVLMPSPQLDNTPVPGDFDGDGDVDLSDFTQFQLCFGGANNPPAPTCPPGVNADLDDDGDVDLADFLIFQQNFTGSL